MSDALKNEFFGLMCGLIIVSMMQILEIYILLMEVSHQDFILKTRWDKKCKSGQLAQEKHNWKSRREDGNHSRFLLSPFFTAGSSVPRR